MCNSRLDARDSFPSGMEEYLSMYGWHFSKRMSAWAVSRMTGRDGKPVSEVSSEEVDGLLKRFGITLKNDKAYDRVYVCAMAKADYFGSSISDDIHLARFIKDYLDDPDGYDGMAFTRFYADMIGKGMPIPWEDCN